MRNLKIVIISLMAITLLSGCIDILFSSAKLTKKKAEIQTWLFLAEDGDVEAQYKVGTLYCCGERPYFNNVEALKWWCAAAKGGQRDAQFEVGRMYDESSKYEGNIIPNDTVLSYVYFSMAADNGHVEAALRKKHLEPALTEAEKTEAAMLTSRFPRVWCENPR